MKALSPSEAAERIRRMRRTAETQNIREPVTGATAPPLPYRHALIGISNFQTPELRQERKDMARMGICGRKEGYPGCGREMNIMGHGLCATCYRKLPEQKERVKRQRAAKKAACLQEAQELPQVSPARLLSSSPAAIPAIAPPEAAPQVLTPQAPESDSMDTPQLAPGEVVCLTRGQIDSLLALIPTCELGRILKNELSLVEVSDAK